MESEADLAGLARAGEIVLLCASEFVKTLSMKGAELSIRSTSELFTVLWFVVGAMGSTLYRLLVGRIRLYGASLRWRISERVVYATRVSLALAGAKGWLRVSMCQIASEIWRAMSTWATFAPRCLPSRRLLRS